MTAERERGMFWHVVLGLMRDGKRRHGYELRALYLKRSGTQLGTGNFYREITRLTSQGFVQTVSNPPEADERRIPYEITELGKSVFDRWLMSERREHDDLFEWILFLDRVPAETRDRVLARRLEDCWIRNKMLARAREDGSAEAPQDGYDSRFASITRQMKQVAAEIDFIEELREQVARWENSNSKGELTEPQPSTPAVPQPTRPSNRRGAGAR